jgi:uncharacterized protein (UPF0332 family)
MKKKGHLGSYNQFFRSYQKDIKEGESLIKPIVENALLSMFHLIEAVLALDNLHVNKHQLLPGFLRKSSKIRILPKEKREELADLYEELERIRPAMVYGAKDDGETLERIQKILHKITDICSNCLREE